MEKAHKILEGKLRFVVSCDIYLDRVEALCSRTLIGKLEYASMDKKDWFAWATEHWNPSCLTFLQLVFWFGVG